MRVVTVSLKAETQHGRSRRKSLVMSALGHKRTSKHVRAMSALPPRANILLGLIRTAIWQCSPRSAAPSSCGCDADHKLNGMFDADHRNQFSPHPSVTYHFLRLRLDLPLSA